MPGNETGSEWRTILGHPQLIECMGICVLSLAHGSELRGSDVICILRTIIWKFFFKFSQGSCPWIAFACIFFGIFIIFFLKGGGGSMGQIICRKYTVYRALNISCSRPMASVTTARWTTDRQTHMSARTHCYPARNITTIQ